MRRLSLAEHGAIELLGGLLLIAAPLVVGFGPAGLLVAVVAGALLAAAATVELALGAATRWTRRA